VIDKFSRMKEEFEGSAFQTKEQKQWTDMQRLLRCVCMGVGVCHGPSVTAFAFCCLTRACRSIKPKVQKFEPSDRIRKLVFRVVIHAKFDLVIMIAIMLNTFTMTLEHYNMSDSCVQVSWCARGCVPLVAGGA